MKHLITLACLLVAICFYVAGMSSGFVVFIVAGFLAEGAFWFRLLRRMPRQPSAIGS